MRHAVQDVDWFVPEARQKIFAQDMKAMTPSLSVPPMGSNGALVQIVHCTIYHTDFDEFGRCGGDSSPDFDR